MKTTLILIDIQNDYFDKGTMTLVGSDKAGMNAKLILERFRARQPADNSYTTYCDKSISYFLSAKYKRSGNT